MVKTRNTSLLLLTDPGNTEASQAFTVLCSEDSKALKSLQMSPALHDCQFNLDRMRRYPSTEKYTSYSHRLWIRILLAQALVFPTHSLGGILTSICQDYSLFIFSLLAMAPCYLIKISSFWLQVSSEIFMLNFFSAVVPCDKIPYVCPHEPPCWNVSSFSEGTSQTQLFFFLCKRLQKKWMLWDFCEPAFLDSRTGSVHEQNPSQRIFCAHV